MKITITYIGGPVPRVSQDEDRIKLELGWFVIEMRVCEAGELASRLMAVKDISLLVHNNLRERR